MKKKKKAHGQRNAARPASRPAAHRNATTLRETTQRAGRAVGNAARSARQRLEAPDPHAWQDVLATVVAGGGAAVLGGYAVRKGIDPKVVSAVMVTAGIAGAFGFKGTLRTAATSIAGAGAGQLALTIMQEKAIEELKQAMATASKPAITAGDKPANALPPGSFDSRFALHSQIADDAARFTEPEAEYAYPYADAAA